MTSLDASSTTTVLIGLGVLAMIGANLATIIMAVRRKPTIDQTLAKDYVRQKDFARCQEHCEGKLSRIEARQEAANREIYGTLRQQNAEIGTKLDGLQKDLKHWQIGMSAQAGNLDGRVNRLERQNG